MRALVLEAPRELRLRERPAAQAGEGEVLLRVAATGVCGSDLSLFHRVDPGVPLPLVPGHEFGGWSEDGSFYVVNPMLACGRCALCAAGRTHLCGERKVLGFRRDGAYAQQVVVPRRNLVPAPGLSPLQAALVEPIANGVHAWARAGRPLESVAIIGVGAIGMCLLHVLRSQGARGIAVADPVPERRELALAAGADSAGAQLEGRFDAVFDAAGTQATRADALACTVPGGTVALIGLHDDSLALSAASLVVGDRTLCGCFAYTEQEFRDAVVLARTIAAPWAVTVPLENAEAALADLLAGRAPPRRIKTVIGFPVSLD
jgi:threonine dehydrogenase-like Zn-dependent dehydrogenase